MTDAKRGTPREGAPLQNFRPEYSDSTPQIATSTASRAEGRR
jgi:hypothetical protein